MPMLAPIAQAIRTLEAIDVACVQERHADALRLLRQMERDSLPAIRQAIKDLAAPTLDYEGWVREVVAREERSGRGASLAYAFTRYDDNRYDHQQTLAAIHRLVDADEFVIKNQTVYTPEGWERTKAERASKRTKQARRW